MFTPQEIEVLNKIKQDCKEQEECRNCKYFDLVNRCVFNKDFPMNWEVDVNER